MMIQIVRTTPDNPDFIQLIQLLDKDIETRDGDEHVFFAQFNKTDSIKNAIVVYENEIPLGCGAFKYYESDIAEIKRMYVNPEARGKGIATKVLNELAIVGQRRKLQQLHSRNRASVSRSSWPYTKKTGSW